MERIAAIGYDKKVGYLVAEEHGLFARHGLEVSYERAGHAPTHNQGMVEGRWDMTLSSADTMIARATRDGADFVLFMNVERGLDVRLVAEPSIASVANLRGKRLAGDPGDSNYDLHRRKIMRDYGLGDDEYEVEIIGASKERFEALLAGRVVAAMLSSPYYQGAAAKGFRILADGADHVPNYPTGSGWTRRAWAEANRDKLVRFIRAIAEGNDWALSPANHEAAVDLIFSRSGVPPAQAESKLARAIPHAEIDPAGLAQVVALRAELGLYDPPYDPIERFYDASYWAEATGRPAPAPYGIPDLERLRQGAVTR